MKKIAIFLIASMTMLNVFASKAPSGEKTMEDLQSFYVSVTQQIDKEIKTLKNNEKKFKRTTAAEGEIHQYRKNQRSKIKKLKDTAKDLLKAIKAKVNSPESFLKIKHGSTMLNSNYARSEYWKNLFYNKNGKRLIKKYCGYSFNKKENIKDVAGGNCQYVISQINADYKKHEVELRKTIKELIVIRTITKSHPYGENSSLGDLVGFTFKLTPFFLDKESLQELLIALAKDKFNETNNFDKAYDPIAQKISSIYIDTINQAIRYELETRITKYDNVKCCFEYIKDNPKNKIKTEIKYKQAIKKLEDMLYRLNKAGFTALSVNTKGIKIPTVDNPGNEKARIKYIRVKVSKTVFELQRLIVRSLKAG